MSAGHATPGTPASVRHALAGEGAVPFSRPQSPHRLPEKTVGFVGLGNIGSNVATNLAIHCASATSHHGTSHIKTIILHNRTRAKADAVGQEITQKISSTQHSKSPPEIKIVESVEEVVEASDIIITSLPSDAAVIGVYDAIAATLKRLRESGSTAHKIVADMSTVYPTLTGKLDVLLSSTGSGVSFVAAPVFGAPAAAKAAQLVLVLAGEYRAKKEVAWLLVPASARKAIDVGANVEKAPTFKLIGNSFIAGTLELLAETFTLAEKTGIGKSTFHTWLNEMAPTPSVANYSNRILNDNFDAKGGFEINGGLKDVRHIQHLAQDHNVPFPIMDLVQQHLLTAKAIHQMTPVAERKFAALDWSALTAASRIGAGIDPFDSTKTQVGVVPEDEH